MQKKKWSEAKFIFVVFSLLFIFFILFLLVFTLQQKTNEPGIKNKLESKIPSFSGGASSGTGTLRFCLDKSPTLTNPSNQNATANIRFNITINYADDGCSSISFSDNSSLFNISSTGLINFTPSGEKVEAINITISDYFFSRSALFNITISPALNLEPNYTKFSDLTTNSSSFSESEYYSTSRYTLETSSARITWLDSVNISNQNFDQYVNFSSGFISLDIANLHSSFNSSAQLSIENVTCPVNVYFVPYVALSNDDIISNGTSCSSTTDPSCTNIICSGTTVTFNVSHFSSYGAQSSSGGGGATSASISTGSPLKRLIISSTPTPTQQNTDYSLQITDPFPLSIPQLEQPQKIIAENKSLTNSSTSHSPLPTSVLPTTLLILLSISLVILSLTLSRR